jgi:hypothetical protein
MSTTYGAAASSGTPPRDKNDASGGQGQPALDPSECGMPGRPVVTGPGVRDRRAFETGSSGKVGVVVVPVEPTLAAVGKELAEFARPSP